MAGTNLECEGGKGGDDGNDEDVDVGDHDDGALVRDALAHAGRGEGTPLVDVEDLQGGWEMRFSTGGFGQEACNQVLCAHEDQDRSGVAGVFCQARH